MANEDRKYVLVMQFPDGRVIVRQGGLGVSLDRAVVRLADESRRAPYPLAIARLEVIADPPTVSSEDLATYRESTGFNLKGILA